MKRLSYNASWTPVDLVRCAHTLLLVTKMTSFYCIVFSLFYTLPSGFYFIKVMININVCNTKARKAGKQLVYCGSKRVTLVTQMPSIEQCHPLDYSKPVPIGSLQTSLIKASSDGCWEMNSSLQVDINTISVLMRLNKPKQLSICCSDAGSVA